MSMLRTQDGRRLPDAARVCAALACLAWGTVPLRAEEATCPLVDAPEKARAAQKAWAEQFGKPVQWTNAAGMKFQLIPPGEFVMGSSSDPDAAPHRVRLTRPFYLATTEVTRGQWEAVMGSVRSTYFPGPDAPINCIDWRETQAFLAALNKKENAAYRLPTEAEWEFAARAGSAGRFPGGDAEKDLEAAGWYVKNSGNALHPVARKAPNAFGLFDMHGNAWEWCEDFYDAAYYAISPLENPAGPDPKRPLYRYRVLRGGSVYYGAEMCASGHRDYYQESRYDRHFGFRVLLPIEAKPQDAPPAPAAK